MHFRNDIFSQFCCELSRVQRLIHVILQEKTMKVGEKLSQYEWSKMPNKLIGMFRSRKITTLLSNLLEKFAQTRKKRQGHTQRLQC